MRPAAPAQRRRGLYESRLMDVPPLAALHCSKVHKRRPENVLIAGLHRAGDGVYRATLRICDE
ncbi:hypothetical protein [Streptomyces sp. NPDC048106]|uniref:hypothetical protein n=1 Tax=Streptomyces sp. NPDC048106 TaxID=3155750 RepID=UPI003453A6B3